VLSTKDNGLAPEAQKMFAARSKAPVTAVAVAASLVVHAREVAEKGHRKAALVKWTISLRRLGAGSPNTGRRLYARTASAERNLQSALIPGHFAISSRASAAVRYDR